MFRLVVVEIADPKLCWYGHQMETCRRLNVSYCKYFSFLLYMIGGNVVMDDYNPAVIYCMVVMTRCVQWKQYHSLQPSMNGQNEFTVQPNNFWYIYSQPPKVIIYKLVWNLFWKSNFETRYSAILDIFQNSATMAKCCHQNRTISNHFLNFFTLLMIIYYLNIYLHGIILILITFYELGLWRC